MFSKCCPNSRLLIRRGQQFTCGLYVPVEMMNYYWKLKSHFPKAKVVVARFKHPNLAEDANVILYFLIKILFLTVA